ncbi:FAD-dependent oxidoreductase [Arthrobacter sp. Sa2CUA1]|uniref:FAD-dependent oxidoreductase n=1 Tax=Arthrobacter gallicola TaxID=2762225 RepID=A0ABR8UMT3_9MICC|nr:FAD-dependent oxidoreductase [Arthrobacter gallicola]MBD7993860.1 FAD-dependent oxidoreductase [Arthrobacter gallicola]
MDTTAVILGGGYAGVMAANRLAGQGHPVMLVTPDERFTQRIRLHEYTAGTRADPRVDYATLLNPKVQLLAGRAEAIRPVTRTVRLVSGVRLDYGYLVYAVGSGEGRVPPGAVAPDRFSGAVEARTRLSRLAPGERIAVVGGGLTAVEVAAETAGAYPENPLTLYTAGNLVPHFSAGARAGLLRGLRSAGVRVQTGTVNPDRLPEAGVVLWCAGFGVPQLAARSGLPVDAAGRLALDATLRVPGQDRIYGAGDAAVITDPGYGYLPMTCASAMPMGAEAAGNILRSAAGTPPARHNSGFLGQCVSLGRRDGAVQFLTADYTARSFHLHGRSAAVLKEVLCRMTLRWIRGEAKKSGAYTWPAGPRMTPEPSPQVLWS